MKRKREAQWPQWPPPRREIWHPNLPATVASWRAIAIRFLFFVILFIIVLGVLEHNRL